MKEATLLLVTFLYREMPASEEVIFQTLGVTAFVERVSRAGGSVLVDVERKAAPGVKIAV